jgi:hypothetical protein
MAKEKFPDRLPVGDLADLAADYNPRKITDQKLAALRKSLRKYGHVQLVVVNKRTKRTGWQAKATPVIVGGHQTVRAAALERIDELAIRWVDLDRYDEQELNIALNAIDGDWDQKLLAPLLAGLESVKAERGGLETTGFTETEITDILTAGLAEDEDEEEELEDRLLYGGATALERGSVPWRHWKKAKLLEGDVLDFGSGKEDQGVARFDAFTHPDYSVLLERWDTVTCNYVLNTQPADHLVLQICVILAGLLRPGGQVLIACITPGKALDGTRAAGGREAKSRREWEDLLERIFVLERVKSVGFLGWICRPKGS